MDFSRTQCCSARFESLQHRSLNRPHRQAQGRLTMCLTQTRRPTYSGMGVGSGFKPRKDSRVRTCARQAPWPLSHLRLHDSAARLFGAPCAFEPRVRARERGHMDFGDSTASRSSSRPCARTRAVSSLSALTAPALRTMTVRRFRSSLPYCRGSPIHPPQLLLCDSYRFGRAHSWASRSGRP